MAQTFNYDQETKKVTKVANVRDTNTPSDRKHLDPKTMGGMGLDKNQLKKASPRVPHWKKGKSWSS